MLYVEHGETSGIVPSVCCRELGTDARTVGHWEHGQPHPLPLLSRTALSAVWHGHGNVRAAYVQIAFCSPTNRRKTHQFDPAWPHLLLPSSQIIGREVLLDTLFPALEGGTTHILYGLPGVGKTTLARFRQSRPAL